MLNVRYYKDYRHNYLIMEDNGALTENVYQRKMISENRIKGLLPVSEKHINGELLLYYEITSRQSMKSLYAMKKIDMKQLKSLFVQLRTVGDALQKYLLDESCLVLAPEYIFQNVETGEASFLYYPDPEEGTLQDFVDFLVEKVDGEDGEAVETVYRIADLVQREQFVLDEILKWFQDDYDKKEPEETQPKEVFMPVQEEPEPPLQEEKKENRLKKLMPAAGVCITGLGLLIYVVCCYQLSYREWIYVAGGFGLIVIIAVCAVSWYLFPLFAKGEKERKQGQEQRREPVQIIQNWDQENAPSLREVGNTVYVPWTESCENKLYGTDRKNKYHIDLSRLPLTVGKLPGAVDMVLEEPSVSRMHARFTKTGSAVYITDLNSTNGTFRNGMRLAPNACEIIEPGDEIKIGKLNFIYR